MNVRMPSSLKYTHQMVGTKDSDKVTLITKQHIKWLVRKISTNLS